LEVIDQGPGIPRAHLDHIFERFYRVDRSRSRLDGGSGLGLPIVQWAVEAHGGEVQVESTEGKGSIFRICLPNGAGT
jgi:two-component system phosphate regulon sensor histidine kinase PhoR